jgi:hypothetical protein
VVAKYSPSGLKRSIYSEGRLSTMRIMINYLQDKGNVIAK